VEITYELDDTAFATVEGNGFDSDGFAADLSTELGVNLNDIIVTVLNGEIIIKIIIVEAGDETDPIGTDVIQEIQDIESQLDNIKSDLVSELGIDNSNIVSIELDLCGTRDCNNRGTCDSETGVCDCNGSYDYWGINCETLVNCNSGSKMVNDTYCLCPYPFYGQTCEKTKNCSVC
jgi:hypothetical protein